MTDIHFHQDQPAGSGIDGLLPRRSTLQSAGAWLNVPLQAEDFIASRPSLIRLMTLILITDVAFLGTMLIKMALLQVHPAVTLDRFDFGFWVAIAFVGRTVFLVFLANALTAFGTVVGAPATTRSTFTGVVWGVAMAMRVAILSALIAAALNALQPFVPALGAKSVLILPYLLSFFGFVWYVAKGAASAHRIDPMDSVVIATFLLSLVGWVATVLLVGLQIAFS